MAITGTTGTGLDGVVALIANDYGLNSRISGAALREGAAAADGINALIVAGILGTGVANDGVITTSDVYTLNAYIRTRSLATFTALHGNDEGDAETAFHQVQGDGAVTRLFGEAAVDTILDGLYHIGFQIRDGRFANEDGNANATVDDVAFWLNTLLAPELAAGSLANARLDPQVHGTTNTGLDALVETIVDDAGLNDRLSQREINYGARAADGMNALIVAGIRATGIADDGTLTALDMRDLNRWIATNHLAAFTAFHGDDENGTETGFHLVQGDGGRSYLYAEQAVNTIADGIYHLGFDIQWDRFANEDGNANARLVDVADWLTLLLAEDLVRGTLASGHATVDPATLTDDVAFSRPALVVADGAGGAIDYGRPAALRLANTTIALDFRADAPDNGQTQVLFAKDGASAAVGDLTVYVRDGGLHLLIQDAAGDHWMTADGVTIEAATDYSLALSLGTGGVQLYLNGEKVLADYAIGTALADNVRDLIVAGGNWGRSASNPTAIWNQFDGQVSGFTVYDHALDRFEIAALNHSGALPPAWDGVAARDGAQPAVHVGTGLIGTVYDRSTSFPSIDTLIAATATLPADRNFTAARVDFGGYGEVRTLGAFFGEAATLTDGGAATAMTTIGLHLTGYIYLAGGTHLVTARSDDGFLLQLGGAVVSSQRFDYNFEPTSQAITVTGGLYAIDLFHYENNGREGLRLEIDGKIVGPEAFFATIADYDAALAATGAMPAGGLPPVYGGPVGTTGTGLDSLITVIGTDNGIANNVSRATMFEGAAAADTINHLIVEAITAVDALADGYLTVSEVYDLSDWIRANRLATFLAAHGNDENGIETGLHVIQGNGGTSYLYGENAIDAVIDSIGHIGFATRDERFANEDGNANERVETVTYWLNDLLGLNPLPAPGPGPALGAGSAAAPNVIEASALNTRLAAGALNLRLTGTAVNGTGNAADNRLTGNAYNNILDGGDGADTLIGGAGDTTLIGGRGADLMSGGDGDDTYFLDELDDTIVERAGVTGGSDTVHLTGTAFTRYTLATGLEHLIFSGITDLAVTGNRAANRITTGAGGDLLDGAEGDDVLDGGLGADQLRGGLGNDLLDGGAGGDRLIGGAGNDIYAVDDIRDRVIELAGEGVDTVRSTITFTLGTTFEYLVLEGGARINGIGNASANRITGNGADNLIDGRGGADRMEGGGGNDRYIVDNIGDRVIEAMGQGIDQVYSSVSFALTGHVENLTLTGAGNLSATGNALDNMLRGNAGRNAISGGRGDDVLAGYDGDDVLTGGSGADRLTGGAGADRFVFDVVADSGPIATARDTITDFAAAQGDRIDLRAITPGVLRVTDAFHNRPNEVIFAASGDRWLVSADIDGNGVADFTLTVNSATPLQAADFML